MKLDSLTYGLPPELIAHSPITPRDHSKLMVINRGTKSISHKHFYDLPDLLTPNDVLVFNQTKVFPARLIGKRETGGKIELLLLKQLSPFTWDAIGKGKISLNQKLLFKNATGIVTGKKDNQLTIHFDHPPKGEVPLPPYIHSHLPQNELTKKYQTVYAREEGSVAAPTAGFHFTNKLLKALKLKGIQMEFVTLHVGLGTFLPIKEFDITKHKIHSEEFTLTKETAHRLNESKRRGRRIISVGTTTTRVLENCSVANFQLAPASSSTDIYIYPPYKFKFVDALITNFHLPHSTLLALVGAFVSKPNTDQEFVDFRSSLMGQAYEQAIGNHYRFYSFGDASIIL